jgi:hypothetical protein
MLPSPMKKLAFLVLALPAAAENSMEAALNILDYEFGSERLRINPAEALNPLIGALINGMGVVYNMCRISPEARTASDATGPQGMDGASHGPHRILACLFPSEKGSREGRDAFFRMLGKNGREKATKFLCMLMAGALDYRIQWSHGFSDGRFTVGIKAGNETLRLGSSRKMPEVLSILGFFSCPQMHEMTMANFLNSKVFLVHAILFEVLDYKRESREFFNLFFKLVKDDREFLLRYFAREDGPRGMELSELHDAICMGRAFPFSPLRPTHLTAIVDRYCSLRKKYSNSGGFSDCVEITALELLCCLLCNNREASYSIGHLKDASLPLIKFFRKFSTFSDISMEMRKEWLAVVEDLSDERIKYSRRSYVPPEKSCCFMVPPFTKKRLRNSGPHLCGNSLQPGFLNMLLVFKAICGLEGETYESPLFGAPRAPEDISAVNDEFRRVFGSILFGVCRRREDVGIRLPSLEVLCRGGGRSWDIFGSVEIEIKVDSLTVKLLLEHTPAHSILRLSGFPFVMPRNRSRQHSSNIVLNLMQRYASLTTNNIERITRAGLARLLDADIQELYYLGPLDTDRRRAIALDAIFLENSKSRRGCLEQMMSNIVALSEDREAAFEEHINFIPSLHESRIGSEGDMLALMESAFRKRYLGLIRHLILMEDPGLMRVDIHCYRSLMSFLIAGDGERDEFLELLVGLPHIREDVVVHGFTQAMAMGNAYYTQYFFHRIQASCLLRCNYLCPSSLRRCKFFTSMMARESCPSRGDMEKIYHFYFLSNVLASAEDFILLLKETEGMVSRDLLFACFLIRPSEELVDVYVYIMDLLLRKKEPLPYNFIVLICQVLMHECRKGKQSEMDPTILKLSGLLRVARKERLIEYSEPRAEGALFSSFLVSTLDAKEKLKKHIGALLSAGILRSEALVC